MIESCGHDDAWFGVTSRGRTILLCWACLLEALQELKLYEAVLVTRERE